MGSKRFKRVVFGLLFAVLFYAATAILNKFIGNKLLASLIAAAVIGAYPSISLFRALFGYEAREKYRREIPIRDTLLWAGENAPSEYKTLRDRYFQARRQDVQKISASSSDNEKDTNIDRQVERAYNCFYDALNGLPPDSKVYRAFIENLAKGASAPPARVYTSLLAAPPDAPAEFEAAASASIKRHGVQEGSLRLAESHPEWRRRLYEWLRAHQHKNESA